MLAVTPSETCSCNLRAKFEYHSLFSHAELAVTVMVTPLAPLFHVISYACCVLCDFQSKTEFIKEAKIFF